MDSFTLEKWSEWLFLQHGCGTHRVEPGFLLSSFRIVYYVDVDVELRLRSPFESKPALCLDTFSGQRPRSLSWTLFGLLLRSAHMFVDRVPFHTVIPLRQCQCEYCNVTSCALDALDALGCTDLELSTTIDVKP